MSPGSIISLSLLKLGSGAFLDRLPATSMNPNFHDRRGEEHNDRALPIDLPSCTTKKKY
jgi:hypothetical protein